MTRIHRAAQFLKLRSNTLLTKKIYLGGTWALAAIVIAASVVNFAITSTIAEVVRTVVATCTMTATTANTPTGTSQPKTKTPDPFYTPTLIIITDAYFEAMPYPFMRYAKDWTVSEDGAQFVSFWEGYVGSPYDDGGPGVGNCTIGYGHLLHIGPCNGSEGPASISKYTAQQWLQADLDHCGTYVAKYTTVRLTQTQYNILTGLVCGWGYEKYARSDVLKYLNQGHYFLAAEKLKTTAIYGIGIGLCPGLVRRRSTEANMFVQSVWFSMWPFMEIK
jgi:lysozyme